MERTRPRIPSELRWQVWERDDFTCQSCGADGQSDEQPSACPTCGSVDIELTGGDELMLELLEYRA